MLITKQLFKNCTKYLSESGFERTSHSKGVNVFLKSETYDMVYLQIIDDEVVYNKKHIISCMSDLINIISIEYGIEYAKFPKLNQWIVKISSDLNCIKESSDLDRFLKEISNSIIESKLNGIEETKVKYKIKK